MAERVRRTTKIAAPRPEPPPFAALHRAVHAVQQAVHESDLGVTHPEAVVLALLATNGQTTMGEIHRSFGFRKSTVTNVVDRLVARGLVARTAAPSDGRSVLVSLTPAGAATGRQVLQAFRAVEPHVTRILANRE